jgi:hypothetical protein
MKALIQTGSSLSACGHAQAGGRVPVPLKSDFLSICMTMMLAMPKQYNKRRDESSPKKDFFFRLRFGAG